MLQGSLNKVDSLNAASGLYSFNSKGSSFIHNLVSFFYSGVGAAAIPARLRLRKNLGERAFSPAAVIVSISFYIFLCYNTLFFYMEDDETLIGGLGTTIFLLIPINAFTYFIVTTLIKAYEHFKAIYSYSADKAYTYSYYRGDPISNDYSDKIGTKLYGHLVDESTIRIYFEPRGFAIKYLKRAGWCLLAIVIIGALAFIANLDPANLFNSGNVLSVIAGFWLFSYMLSCVCLSISGFCLMIEELAIVKKIRDTVLDMVDGEYDMQFILKEKEQFATNGIASEQGVDLAESIFQNRDSVILASFPGANHHFLEADTEPTLEATASFPKEVTISQVVQSVLDSKNEKLPVAPINKDQPITKEPEPLQIDPKTVTSAKASEPFKLKDGIVTAGVVLLVGYMFYICLDYGLLPSQIYVVDKSAQITPRDTEIRLKRVEGGYSSSEFTFEITNRGSDTLVFPFLNPSDNRTIRIEAKKISAAYFNDLVGMQPKDSIMTILPKREQAFGTTIIVPPGESMIYPIKFDDFGLKASKHFSIISEDKMLNQTYILFRDIKL